MLSIIRSGFFQVVSLAQHKTPNKACARLVGVCAFSGSLRGLKLVPSKSRYKVATESLVGRLEIFD